jgi:aldose sugar dehydrogenase
MLITLITLCIVCTYLCLYQFALAVVDEYQHLSLPPELSLRKPSGSIPEFVLYDKTTDLLTYGLASFWNKEACFTIFKCHNDFTTGWNDSSSFRVSTGFAGNETQEHWSWIRGNEISVVPEESYTLITHIRINEFAKASNIVLEVYNETSKNWDQLIQCPSGLKGPTEWKLSKCTFDIPMDTHKARIALNAGLSLFEDREAVTWFDEIYMRRSTEVTPILIDPSLKLNIVLENISNPTTMAFLDQDDFLLLERVNGTVERFVNSQKLNEPLLDLEVSQSEGLLGMAISNSTLESSNNTKQVYLYYTPSTEDCACQGIGNLLVRYDLAENNTKLINPMVLLDLPTGNWPLDQHHGGPVAIGPDGNIYLATGDLGRVPEIYSPNQHWNYTPNKATNSKEGMEPDGSAGILRISPDGLSVDNVLGNKHILDKYYAYGIRNSFGLDFDPITGNLWITENGPDRGDEINLVEPGFNSGWAMLAGTNYMYNNSLYEEIPLPRILFDFNGTGFYHPPKFEWKTFSVGPTAMTFIDSDIFGEKYRNNLFVGDTKGNLYLFTMNDNRTGFNLPGDLHDNTAVSEQQLEPIIVGKDFGIITDLKTGPDGFLYVVTLSPSKVYKISQTLSE